MAFWTESSKDQNYPYAERSGLEAKRSWTRSNDKWYHNDTPGQRVAEIHSPHSSYLTINWFSHCHTEIRPNFKGVHNCVCKRSTRCSKWARSIFTPETKHEIKQRCSIYFQVSGTIASLCYSSTVDTVKQVNKITKITKCQHYLLYSPHR